MHLISKMDLQGSVEPRVPIQKLGGLPPGMPTIESAKDLTVVVHYPASVGIDKSDLGGSDNRARSIAPTSPAIFRVKELIPGSYEPQSICPVKSRAFNLRICLRSYVGVTTTHCTQTNTEYKNCYYSVHRLPRFMKD